MSSGLLLAAAALHLGFQVTVTVLVYPALAAESADRWGPAHARHTRRILPLVVVIYGLLVIALGTAFVTGPIDGGLMVAAAGAALALGTTAIAAGPLHGRLRLRDQLMIDRLLRVDRLRAAGAVICVIGAIWWSV